MVDKKVALITGGTKGLGKAIAQRLLKAGLDVVLTYANDGDAAAKAQGKLQDSFPERKIYTLHADATDHHSIDVIEGFIQSNNVRLSALILNAGLTARGDFTEITPEAWQEVFEANLNVPVFTIQRLLGHFADGASVIFTGSLMGIHPHSMSLAYGVSKAAVHALVENLVKFLTPYGVRVNGVAPGFVDTEWQKEKPEEIRQSINSKLALGRFARPEEIAETYLNIIKSPYLTGQVLVVDGGYSFR